MTQKIQQPTLLQTLQKKALNQPSCQHALATWKNLTLSRLIDKKMAILVKQNKGSTFFLSCAGHELVGTIAATTLISKKDWAFPYYRDRAFALAFGVSPVEIFGAFLARNTAHHSSGRMMLDHFSDKTLRIPCQSSVVGSQFLQAVGVAKSIQLKNLDELVYVSGGDGSTSQGDFHEALNFASLQKLPIIFVIQDNDFAISTPLSEQTANSIAERSSGYKDLFVQEIDGTDYLTTKKAFDSAVTYSRVKKGPSLIVAKVPRLESHTCSDDQKKYKDEKLLQEEKAKDPLPRLETFLINQGISQEELQQHKEEIQQIVEKAALEAEKIPFPSKETVLDHVFKEFSLPTSSLLSSTASTVSEESEASESLESKNHLENKNYLESLDNKDHLESQGSLKSEEGLKGEENLENSLKIQAQEPIVIMDAIQHALQEEMQKDSSIIVFGEDVAKKKGGVFGVTKNLTELFGDRCFNTPLAESTIIGLAIGLSFAYHKPVVEIQFCDYVWTGINQLVNEISSMHYRSNGEWNCPVVVRMPYGGYIQGGPYHSQSLESIFAHIPGLKIVIPSNAADAKRLLKTAMLDPNPVIFLEHKALYRQKYFCSKAEPKDDEYLPFGKASIVLEGTDLTVITWGMMTLMAYDVAKQLEKENISVEVIDLRTLVPLDKETIFQSIKKTTKVLIAHEAVKTCGFGAELAALIAEEAFFSLDAPIARLAAKDCPIPYCQELEEAVLPQKKQLEEAMRKLAVF